MGRLDGKIALVSGGARGMGASHARMIVAEGGKVVIGDILDGEGQALAKELGANAVYIHLDVTKLPDWEAAVKLAKDKFGGLNVLVNNAGIVNFGTLSEYTLNDWDKVIAINLTGSFLGIKAAESALVESAPSSIINISSTAGFKGFAALHGYTASKFGVRGLTKSVALELATRKVRCNVIHPGNISTPMNHHLDLSGYNPMDRMGHTNEISYLVVHLASDESTFTTGAEFLVDGGELAGGAAIQAK